ncbi:MAG: pseudouridine synthase [Corynebacterium sp.]|uniref:pseudouridine synthase n=1 Tax=Corynebacterium sp. TaxID=1720 RepID=UPI0026DD4F8A|nr:pseudouridine synthase [Corynebacterium sp.]MDO5029471.1 pseudouridine synthase [Corynebacterium sp.]
MGRAAGNRDSWWGASKDRRAAQVDAARHEQEEYIPFEPVIVAATDDYLIVDKPPFLPATPNGRIVANTVQERLREALDEPEIVAGHRLDLLTSGLMLFSRTPETRSVYQQLFQTQQIRKEYECLTVMPDDWQPGQTREVHLLLDPNPGGRGVKVVPIDDTENATSPKSQLKIAHTTVTFLGPLAADIGDLHQANCSCGHCSTRMQVGHWRLQPHTGRTHQLRATMDWLGYPILGEDTYGPSSSDGGDKYRPQLRLTATSLEFVDPMTGKRRAYRSARDIAQAADAPNEAS